VICTQPTVKPACPGERRNCPGVRGFHEASMRAAAAMRLTSVQGPREHVGDLEPDVRRPHPITGDLHHLGRRVDGRHRVSRPRQRLRPQAGPARDLQHASGRPSPWLQTLRNCAPRCGRPKSDPLGTGELACGLCAIAQITGRSPWRLGARIVSRTEDLGAGIPRTRRICRNRPGAGRWAARSWPSCWTG
jgi:hypothetical protein